MPTYTFYIYTTDILVFNSGTNAFDFGAGYDHTVHRLRVDVTDDDADMNNSGDANQLATVYDLDGNVVDSGAIAAPQYAEFSDGNFIDRIEVNGTHYGYITETPLTPGTSYPVTSSGAGGLPHTYFEQNSVPCFGPDTLIDTPDGPRPITALKSGDLVVTYDGAPQPVLWVGARRVSPLTLLADPSVRPIVYEGGVAGVDTPYRPLTLSRQHRVFVNAPEAALVCGQPEVLIPARAFGRPRLLRRPISWHHILLPRHELIRANGVWVESLFAGHLLSQITTDGQHAQIQLALHGRKHGATVRLCPPDFEVQVLMSKLRRAALPQRRNIRVA